MARSNNRNKIVQLIGTPLSFYVLSLLIIETTLGLVLLGAGFETNLRFVGFLLMIVVFSAVLAFVGWLTVRYPQHLVFGKEEHLHPQLTDSALRDQIADIIAKSVRPECLKS